MWKCDGKKEKILIGGIREADFGLQTSDLMPLLRFVVQGLRSGLVEVVGTGFGGRDPEWKNAFGLY